MKVGKDWRRMNIKIQREKMKDGDKAIIYAGACASVLPTPDDSVVDLSLHGRG